MATKEVIRPFYSEFQGLLSQSPDVNGSVKSLYDENLWEHYNQTITELNKITGKNYDRFKLQPKRGQSHFYLDIATYRGMIGGLISRLHGEYFSDEQVPFSGMPTTIINQSQTQNQSIQMLLEINDLLHEKLNKADPGSKEKTFLEKIKGSLSGIKSVSEFVLLLITTAKSMGITIDQLASLFNK
jgi:hypothetical protein